MRTENSPWTLGNSRVAPLSLSNMFLFSQAGRVRWYSDSELIRCGPCLYPPPWREQQGEKQCCADWNASHGPRSASSMLWTHLFNCIQGSDVLCPPERCREELLDALNRGSGLLAESSDTQLRFAGVTDFVGRWTFWPGAGRNRCLDISASNAAFNAEFRFLARNADTATARC